MGTALALRMMPAWIAAVAAVCQADRILPGSHCLIGGARRSPPRPARRLFGGAKSPACLPSPPPTAGDAPLPRAAGVRPP